MKTDEQQCEENWLTKGYCSCDSCNSFGDAFDAVWEAIKKPTGRNEIRRFIQDATRQSETEARNNLDALIDTGMLKGSRYFCESLFWASQPKQAAKT